MGDRQSEGVQRIKSRETGRNAVKLSADMLKIFCPWLRSNYLPASTPGRREITEDLLLVEELLVVNGY